MNNEFYEPNNYEYNHQPEENPMNEEPKKEPKKKKGNGVKWVTCIAMAAAFGLVASLVFYGSGIVMQRVADVFSVADELPDKKEESEQIKVPNQDGEKDTADKTVTVVESNVADVAESVMPSVVSITNLSIQQVQSWPFGGYQEYESQSSGSGIIVEMNDKELLIVTNNHVVEGNTTLTVTFIDEYSMEAKVKGTDANIDLAIIAVDTSDIPKETKAAIKVATLGDSSTLRVGEPAIAIGNALGYGQSVTVGIISALNREIEDFDAAFIQTDAAINPGNSGGALLNVNGEVVGINTAKVQDTAIEGMGYAIPISDISEVLNTLMNRETRDKVEEADRGMIGIECTTVDENTSAIYHVPEGVFISKVTEGGGADLAGLSKGTVITKINGISVTTSEQLIEELSYYCYGEKVKLTVLIPQEDGEYGEKEVEVILQKKTDK